MEYVKIELEKYEAIIKHSKSLEESYGFSTKTCYGFMNTNCSYYKKDEVIDNLVGKVKCLQAVRQDMIDEKLDIEKQLEQSTLMLKEKNKDTRGLWARIINKDCK